MNLSAIFAADYFLTVKDTFMERADLFSWIKACMACAVFLCFYSCSTSDYADSSVNVVVNKDAVVLSSASGNEARTAIVPRYVYLDKDKRSLLVLEDTLGPVYRLNIPVGKEQACNDMIDFAYINEYLVDFRYDKDSHEVSSLRLQGPSVKTRSVKDLIPTGWVHVLDTKLKTYTLKNIHVGMHKEEVKGSRQSVYIYPFSRLFYLGGSSSYESCKRILRQTDGKGLLIDVVLTSETFEIVAFKISGAAIQTEENGSWKSRPRLGILPTECSTLTEDELQKVFNRIVANDCENHLRPDPYPCIPFTYPYDGCFARAHAMRRLVNQMGYECHKVFHYEQKARGSLSVLPVASPSLCLCNAITDENP